MGARRAHQRACYGADTVTALDPPQTASLTGTKTHEAPRRSGAPECSSHCPWTPLPAWTNAALAEHLAVKRHCVEGLIEEKLVVIVRRSGHRDPFMLDPELRQLVVHKLRAWKQVVLGAADDANRLLPNLGEVLRGQRRRLIRDEVFAIASVDFLE